MQSGILGDNEVLRRLWSGPFLDFLVKLNSGDGPGWKKQFKKFLRQEVTWDQDRGRFPSLIKVSIGVRACGPIEFGGNLTKPRFYERDERSLALGNIEASKLLFETCLEKGESRITGEEKIRRLKKANRILLDARFLAWLEKEEGQGTLEWLYATRGVKYLDFLGTTLILEGGHQYALYLERDDDKRLWHSGFRGINNEEWHRGHLSVVIET